MKKHFKHKSLDLNKKTKIVFIAMSKNSFYFRRHAVKFVLKKGLTPISQFGIFDYFLNDAVSRNLVRQANNNLIGVSDELWVFGPLSDGVIAEVKMFKKTKKPIRYFRIVSGKAIKAINKKEVEFEKGLAKFSKEI